MVWAILKDLAVAGGRAAVTAIVDLIRGKQDVWQDVPVSEPPHPGFVDLEHQRQQERASIALSKAQAKQAPPQVVVDRTASTVAPPKTGKLPEQ